MTKITNDNWIWKAILILGFAGIIFMAFVSFSGGAFFEKGNHDVLNYFVTFGISLLVSGACFCFGALMGFLFGIPRIINSTAEPQTRGTVLQNDNLVQISDWLTKILVGVGLTQIYAIPGFLKKVGIFLAPCFDVEASGTVGTTTTGASVAICLVLYFLILGFMACYLWTRFYFSEMLEETINEENPKQSEGNVNKMVNTTVQNMTINSSDPVSQDPFQANPATGSSPASNPVPDPASTSAADPGSSQPDSSPGSSDVSTDPLQTEPVPPATNASNVPDAGGQNPPFNPADANPPENDPQNSGQPQN